MDKDSTYLKYLIDEEIYRIEESQQPDIGDPDPVQGPKPDKIQAFHNKTVILSEYIKEEGIPVPYKKFLSKILEAVGLDLESAVLIYAEDINSITLDQLDACKVIAFLSQVPANFSNLAAKEKYRISALHKNQFILCDPLETIHEDRILKRKLWDQLKILYGIE